MTETHDSDEGPTMRLLRFLLLGGVVALGSGCAWLERFKPRPAVPTEKLEPRSAKDLVAFLNRQAGYLQTIRYDSVSLRADLPGAGWVPRLSSGMLVCGKDRNFRLQAGLIVGGDQIDVGSNSQEMWMYVKQPEPTYLICSHADFPRVQNDLPVPFEPDWVLQAVGLATFPDRPDYRTELSEKNRAHYLTYEDRAANGQPLKKMIEFAGDRGDGSTPLVRRHLVLTQSGDGQKWEVQTIAEIKQVQTVSAGTDPTTGRPAMVQVPTQLLLEWPKQKVTMELRLGDIKVNDGKTPTTMFTRPATIGNVSPINLAEYRQPVPRGAAPRSDLPPPLSVDRRE
jgi:hypothetical protein